MDNPVEVVVNNNGSLRITGNFILKDAEGNVFDLSGRQSISLRRCGHSNNKPFCDSTHKKIGFESVVKARTLPPPVPKPAQ